MIARGARAQSLRLCKRLPSTQTHGILPNRSTRAVRPAGAWHLGIAPLCFDEACRTAADRVFAAAIAAPLLAAAAAIALKLRTPAPAELQQRGTFEDPDTGAFLEPQVEGVTPERDAKGKLVFRAYSYTPMPVEAGAVGERIRIKVGPIKQLEPRTYLFNQVLPRTSRSRLLVATLPRPLGIVFEYDEALKRVCVAGLTADGNAEQRRKVAGLNRQLMDSTAAPGDILRAVTCTNFVYDTRALFGAVPPQRHIVLYGVTPKATWDKVSTALRRGEPSDGSVTLVLERAQGQQQDQDPSA